MCRAELLVLVILFLVSDETGASLFAIGSDCRQYPYSRKCLGVAAKRSAQRLDLQNRLSSTDFLSSLIRRIYEEEGSSEQPSKQLAVQERRDLYDDSPFLDDLANMVRSRNKNRRAIQQTAYINDDPRWDENFETSKNQL